MKDFLLVFVGREEAAVNLLFIQMHELLLLEQERNADNYMAQTSCE